jgi:glutamate synthase (NADPH/NADH) small chain
VTNLAIGKQPPTERGADQPWPMTPTLFEVSSAHEEGGERVFLASTVEFLSNEAGEVRAIRVAETEYLDGRRVPKAGTEREIPADLVLLALGFTGPEAETITDQLPVPFDGRGNIERDGDYQTSESGVFVAGDAGRGQSLIVWAIAEGRAAASAVDRYLEGETQLPFPVKPTDHAIALQF